MEKIVLYNFQLKKIVDISINVPNCWEIANYYLQSKSFLIHSEISVIFNFDNF